MVYRPTARVLTVLELLHAHNRMTGAELARRLEVNIRTVRDYVVMLQDLGIPVEAERGRYGAYRLRPGYKLPPLIFTDDEALALTLSLLMARQTGLTTTTPAVEGVLAKIERVLPAATRARLQAMEQTVSVATSAPTATPSVTTVAVLSLATQHGQRVRLRYRAGQADETERLYDPYGVVYHEGFWYTIGYCHLRQSQRLFRLDRIIQIEQTDDTFPHPQNFDALTAVQHALAKVPRVWQVDVCLAIPLDEAQRQLRISKAHFEAADGGVRLRGDVDDLPWMARTLAGLGVPFRIIHPSELRAAIREYAQMLTSYAEQSEV